MPPSGRKAKARARRAPATETHEPSDIETPEAIATPTRSSRKRARGNEATAPASRNTRRKTKDTRPADNKEDTDGTEPGEPSDAETEPALPSEQEIISHLKIADRQVNATEDFANDLLEGQENVPGYGKIAGRDWAFIIRKVEVNIGRPEAQERFAADEGGQFSGGPSAKTVVDIDLGPDRQVSRSHAVISYDPDKAEWFILVNGRNGLRVDNNLLKRGMKTYLRNGSVVEIANTQMAFITTAAEHSEGPIWDASIIKQAQKSSEDEEVEEDRANGDREHANSAARGSLQDSSTYATHSDLGGQPQRAHPHSQRGLGPATQPPPGTPMRVQQSVPKSSPAANYARGVMMESTETIDYSADSAKDLKPPHSYAQLIGMAVLSTQEQQMTLNNIYKWIMANYAFYRFNTGGWQNSIRHNLSLNKAFTKIARRTDEPGKGMKWMIEPTEFDTFVQQGMKGCRRPNPLPGTQSTLASPTSPAVAPKTEAPVIKRDTNTTPPHHATRPSYPTAREAYTPDRGPRQQLNNRDERSAGLGINGDGPEYDYPRSTPQNGLNAIANAAGSPPALYVNEESRAGALDTPFPLKPTQRLAPPSTLRRPSDFIQFSSPAPFWKMEGLVGSTPFKPYDLSPLKTPFSGFQKVDPQSKHEPTDEEEDADPSASAENSEHDSPAAAKTPSDAPFPDHATDPDLPTAAPRKQSPIIHSSSPPRAGALLPNALEGSPSLSRPATAVAKTLSQLAAAGTDDPASTANGRSSFSDVRTDPQRPPSTAASSAPAPLATDARESADASGPGPASYGYAPGAAGAAGALDEGEDEGFDLAKGFQPIGAFHKHNHLAMGMGPATPAFGQ